MLGALLCFDLHCSVCFFQTNLAAGNEKVPPTWHLKVWQQLRETTNLANTSCWSTSRRYKWEDRYIYPTYSWLQRSNTPLCWLGIYQRYQGNALVWSRCAVCGRGAKSLTFSVLISYSDRRKGKDSCYVGLFQMDYIWVRLRVWPAACYWIQVLVSGY